MRQTERPTYELMLEEGQDGVSVLYQRYGKKLFGYGQHTWKVDEDVNWDIIYQTLYKVNEKIGVYEFDSERSFAAIVFKIYVNFLRKHYRKTQHREQFIQFTTFNESLFEESGEDRSLSAERAIKQRLYKQTTDMDEDPVPESPMLKLLRDELNKLENWQRVLLELKSQNMPYKEIANYIDKPAGQLKVYYQRLKARVLKNVNAKIHTAKNN